MERRTKNYFRQEHSYFKNKKKKRFLINVEGTVDPDIPFVTIRELYSFHIIQEKYHIL